MWHEYVNVSDLIITLYYWQWVKQLVERVCDKSCIYSSWFQGRSSYYSMTLHEKPNANVFAVQWCLFLVNITDGWLQLSQMLLIWCSQGDIRQMMFVMGDGRAAKNHCRLHQPACGVSVDSWSVKTSHNTQVPKNRATLDSHGSVNVMNQMWFLARLCTSVL